MKKLSLSLALAAGLGVTGAAQAALVDSIGTIVAKNDGGSVDSYSFNLAASVPVTITVVGKDNYQGGCPTCTLADPQFNLFKTSVSLANLLHTSDDIGGSPTFYFDDKYSATLDSGTYFVSVGAWELTPQESLDAQNGAQAFGSYRVTVEAVPIPAPFVLLGSALLALGATRRRSAA